MKNVGGDSSRVWKNTLLSKSRLSIIDYTGLQIQNKILLLWSKIPYKPILRSLIPKMSLVFLLGLGLGLGLGLVLEFI